MKKGRAIRGGGRRPRYFSTSPSGFLRHSGGIHGIGVCLLLCLVLFLGCLPENGFLRTAGAAETAAAAGTSENAADETSSSSEGTAGTSEGESGEADDEVAILAVDPTHPGAGYAAILYDDGNGLPTSEANTIAQTADGFLWIGSYSGLVRYDGNVFERMDSSEGIASVVSLFVDSKQRLWVGTNDSGVAVIDKGQTRFFRMEDGLKSHSIRAITEDPDGNIYVATTRGIVEINEAMNVRTIEAKLIRDEFIRNLTYGADGMIYGITQDGQLFTLKQGALECFYDLPNEDVPNVVSVYPDPDNPGCVYLGSQYGEIYHMDLVSSVRRYTTLNTSLAAINSFLLLDGKLWVCADGGIGVVDNDKTQVLSKVPMTVSVNHMLTDYQGNLWFTSSDQGVMKIVSNPFSDVFEWYGLEPTVVNTTCEYRGRIWVGTANGLTVLEDDKVMDRWIITEAKTASGERVDAGNLISFLKGIRIRSIIRDSKERLWFSTYSKYPLIRLEGHKMTCFTVADGMFPKERARTIHECSDGTILVACTGGMVVIRGDRITRVYNDDNDKGNLENTEILTVEEAVNGDYLIGTDGGGIYIARSSGPTVERNTEHGLQSGIVMRIKKDHIRDIYWIVTSNSIAYMDSEYRITTVKNFPYSNNFDIYQNSRDEMWVLSSNGIYVLPTEDMLSGKVLSPAFYNMYNGLPGIPKSNSFSTVTESGDLYIACNNGVTMVNIEDPVEKVADLKISVPYVVADGKEIYPEGDGTIRVPASAKKVVIHSFVFTYSMSNPQVTYWLENFENRKTTVKRTELGPITYTNLRGGTYYFNMEIHDTSGTGSRTFRIRIVKVHAFYELWWFKLLMVLLAIAVICIAVARYVKKKTKKLMEKQREQKIFIDEMTEAFAKTIDMKDSYTNGHSMRVAKYTTILARELGCSEEDIDKYHNIALLHDIGKIGVDDKVLKKEGKLEDDEFKQIKSHTTLGYRVLKDISIMPELAIGAGAHHERPDGKGYPNGLKGDEIPFVAQIIAVADTFDAMYSDRPYRKRMNFDKVVSIIRDAAGTQLSSEVVDAFLRLVDKGYFRAPDDEGGGSTEDIDNIHKSFTRAKEVGAAALKALAEKQAAAAADVSAKATAEAPAEAAAGVSAEASTEAVAGENPKPSEKS
ncbi:MAG: HD domain-containing protein [Lachnospiraceae bacterium]|nr:HD domain-containing protein [Lachnospiraceae bacterium]